MARLMIVDDEPIMRKAVRVIIEKHVPEIREVFDAESGRKAIEMAGQIHPDIVCMDIKMPGIDGIEATRAIKAICPESMIIIISAFDEFKAAATFMKYGIRAYLLKPLDKIEFVKEIYAALDALHQKRSQQKQELDMQEHLAEPRGVLENEVAYSFMMGEEGRLERLHYINGVKEVSTGGISIVVRFLDSGENGYQHRLCYQRLYEKLREYAEGVGGIVCNLFFNRLIVFLYNLSEQSDYEGWMEERVSEVRSLVGVNGGTPIAIGVGPYVESLLEMQSSYHCATQAAMEREGEPNAVFYGGEEKENRSYHYPLAIEREVLLAIEREDVTAAQNSFDEFFENISIGHDGRESAIYRQLMIFAVMLIHLRMEKRLDMRVNQVLESLDDAVSVYKWCRYAIVKTVEDLHGVKEAFSNNLIEDAIAFIHENYSKQITLDDISRQVNVSSFYFTKIFKASTGKTFVEYLTDYRMEIAKKLLRTNPSLKINDIGEMVGYCDYKYFCKRFRSSVGVTPAGYRDQME